MTHMPTEPSPMAEPPSDTPPSKGQIAAVLIAFPLLCFILGGFLLPRPAGTEEMRAKVDRRALSGIVLKSAPALNAPVDARLTSIQVLGANLPTDKLKPGASLPLEFYFKALSETDQNWKIFLHIDRKGATYRIHGDHAPASGRYLTSLWQKGEIIKDVFKTTVPLDAPAGTYEVWLGFYIGDERLKWTGGDASVHDGKNRVRMGTLVVGP